MLTQKRLGDLVKIQMGYSYRNSIPECLDDDAMNLLQVKDIDEQGIIDLKKMNKTLHKDLKDFFLTEGDLIFRSRGPFFMLSEFPQYEAKTIFLAPLFRFTLIDDCISPAYLQWYINRAASQVILNRLSEGSMVKMITKSTLEDLMIPIPSRSVQDNIVHLHKLALREKQLADSVFELRKRLIESIFSDLNQS
jgi:restriction endonuclease S subunit